MTNSRTILLAGLILAAILVLGGIAVGTWVQNTVEAEDILLPLVGTGDGDSVVVARASVRRLNAGDTLSVSCAGQELVPQQVDAITVFLSCNAGVTPPPPPTATAVVPPTATPLPGATATPMADHSNMLWHAPGAHGTIAAHEHGDNAPQWLLDAGYTPAFDHAANTPNENSIAHKHTAMKGWAGKFGNVDWFGIFHLDFNPGGHVSRFHSYQLWLRDSTGAVSHMHGWVDFGEGLNTGPNLVTACNADDSIRPIMRARVTGCGPVQFESWYANASSPGPDIGFNINPNYFAGGDPANPATWAATGGVRNLTRRIEFAYYGKWGNDNLRGDFWTTQFGNVISGPTDPVCDGLHEVEIGTKTYTLLCLRQTIATSLPNVQFPGNAVQRTFPGGSGANAVKLPN